ncbi:killer toxin [Aspergillus campestris IBT 28561]|uniref:Killer toxin n=1 Tax=Aspergillus campestris (strain IBT 28561) TaxID=1392248 RepID=A0A2I1CUB0_ASPC2|nr:killer toxin [Aspergillus campestris IBT 28561]PKY01205.1 killer toxin [Aspergillus campestris IBT 28561]
MKLSTLLIPTILSLSSTTTALGINCRGSGFCGDASSGSGTRLSRIKNKIDAIDDNAHYNNGDHIACDVDPIGSGFCAFFQSTGDGGSAADAKRLVQDLINHGCAACGSVPTGQENDVKNGQLTVNYVGSPRRVRR